MSAVALKKPDSAVAELERMLSQGEAQRRTLEPIWYMNLAYYIGQQWLIWDGGGLRQPKLAKGRVLLVDNRIQPAVRRSLAKRTKTRPTFVSTPRTAAEEDIVASRLGETLLDDLWVRLYLSKRMYTALLWADIAGCGFWKVFWDSEVGRKGEVLLQPNGQILEDENGRPMKPQAFDGALEYIAQQHGSEHADHLNSQVKRKVVSEGDCAVETRSPWQLAIDPLAESFDEARWVIETTVKDPSEVQARYDMSDKPRPDSEASVGLLESRMGQSMGQAVEQKSGVKVKELWMVPCAEAPRGKHCVWVGTQKVREDNNPYNRKPYVMFSGIEVPGRLYPTCIAEQMRGSQTELNKVKSQKAENRNRIGNPPLAVSRQANVKWSGLPGERMYYDSTSQDALPRFIQTPELPGYVQAEIGEIEQALMEQAGSHEVSSAQVPAGVTAAAAINLLQEADDTMLGPVIEDQETQLAHAGTMLLEMCAERYKADRVVRIGGEDGAWDITDFKGAMLNGNTRITVQAGSTMPKSKAAKQAEMTQLLTLFVQNSVPLEPRNLRRFFKEYDAGALERLVGDLDADERQINRETRIFKSGGDVEAQPIVDNHSAHIAGHKETAKGSDFQAWDPEAQQRLLAHIQLHMDAEAVQQGQQMAPPPPQVVPPGAEPGGAEPMPEPPPEQATAPAPPDAAPPSQ